MHVSSAIHQYDAVNIWSKGGFHQSRSPSSTIFFSALDPPLGLSGRFHYQNGSIPSKALGLLLALPWFHPRADLITRVVRRQRSSPRGNQIKIATFSECHSKFKFKVIKSCQKTTTLAGQQPYYVNMSEDNIARREG